MVTATDKMSEFEADICAGRLKRGMSFNQRVWAMVARIPRGKVASYSQVAAALGSRGCRAVGGALNRNPYAPAVPCHRVVGKRGDIVGFACGVERKRELLEEEGVCFKGSRVDMERFQTTL